MSAVYNSFLGSMIKNVFERMKNVDDVTLSSLENNKEAERIER